ncbi:histidine phosphatase family protein [Pseudogracilibacillus auburnensis]|uniref:Broad specificity phosphatase PhoE n=1 Tax=Pseudogracilibacillus auburnensis TaxID=1494959 RepID=A0A2V3W8G9_9BACI|nr:histidine phosphatase family protein [Pseudogracilibacillus auburnensis]PXW90657.1 broad specificity phosphatase PhoE [Pseudogracilibacillus auburnensis]
MTTIGFIRHGITEWNELKKAQGRSDIPLNEVGRKQALELGHRLSHQDWDMIITSDLSRASETAEIIGTLIDIPISSFDDRIREIDCGEIEGTTEEERLIKWGRNWRDLDLGMERFEDVAKRGIKFIEEIVHLHKDKRILVVSHGALIGLTLQRLLPERFPTTYIDNTAITILHNIKGVWDCKLYNCTNHLR